jgi:hypothetical protein
MRPSTFVKQPWEERILIFDLTEAMATGDTIDTITGVTVSSAGVDYTATMVGATAKDATNTKVTAVIKGGSDGTVYWVRVRVVAASGDKIEDDLKLIIKKVGDV